MKTSKRKRSAKTPPVIATVGADVIAETPVAAEPVLETAAVSSSPAATVMGDSGEQIAEAVAESVVDASAEQIAKVIFESTSDVSNDQLVEAQGEQIAEVAAEVVAEPVVEVVVAEVAAEQVAEAVVAEVAAESVAELVVAEEVAEAAAEVAAEPMVAEEAAAPVVVGDPIVVLGSNCSVKDAAALKTSLCAFSNHGDAVTLDVSAVERVDTATMQLLCAFVRDRSGRNQSVTWRGESAALQDAVRLLGVGALLGLEPKGVAA